MYEPVPRPEPAVGLWAAVLAIWSLTTSLAAWLALILVIVVIVCGKEDYANVKHKLQFLSAGLNLLANQTSAGANCCANLTAQVLALNEQINPSLVV